MLFIKLQLMLVIFSGLKQKSVGLVELLSKMTSHGCKGKEPFTFKPKTPHFLMVILQKTLDEQKLMVPVKFVKNHGEHLQNQAILKVPGDATWKVELGKRNGKVWMEKGWKEFADYYSLAYGHFLVFEYRGNSDFFVLILDKTSMEIDYPLSSRRRADHELPHQDVEDSDSEDDKSVEILDGCSFSRKKRERSPLPSPGPRKIIKTDPTTKNSVIEKANAFKSQNPFFSVVMQPSYVHGRSNLNIPYKFAKEYFKENRGQVILRVSNGRAWSVNYAINVSGKQKAYFYGSCNWVAFMKDSNLNVGDICVFELVKDIEISLQVFIFRLNEGANCRPSISQAERGKSSVGKFDKGSSSSGVPEAAATKTAPPYPFFNVVIRQSCFVSHHVHVPKSFAEKYVKHEKQEMQLQVGDSSWRVKLNYPAFGTGRLSAGWMAFARGNSLKAGNICTFELIKRNVLRVSISRNGHLN